MPLGEFACMLMFMRACLGKSVIGGRRKWARLYVCQMLMHTSPTIYYCMCIHVLWICSMQHTIVCILSATVCNHVCLRGCMHLRTHECTRTHPLPHIRIMPHCDSVPYCSVAKGVTFCFFMNLCKKILTQRMKTTQKYSVFLESI